jgi:hypothetical protein
MIMAAVAGCLISFSSAKAQSDAPAGVDTAPEYGVLGHPYVSMDGKILAYRNAGFPTPTAYGADMKINFDTADFFDFGLNYGFAHGKNYHWQFSDQVAGLYGTGFYKTKWVTPYFTAGVGYGWEHEIVRSDTTVISDKNHRGLYDFGTGVELPVIEGTSVRLGIDHAESMRRPHPSTWTYQAAINYNFDDLFGIGAGFDYQSGHKANHDALVYHLGVRFMFD